MNASQATLVISFFAGILGHTGVMATQVSRFCPECTDATSAAQKATTFTPPVQCDWPNGTPEIPIPDDLVCYSTDLDVLLVNPLTGDLYAYQLRFEPLLNGHVLQTRPMSPDERPAAQATVEIYQELATAKFGSRSGDATGLKIDRSGIRNSMEWPDGTALDHVLNPELREWMLDLTFLFEVEFAPNLSRAAGEEVNLLMSGQATVDSPCVIDKLAQHEQDNPGLEFRVGGPGGAPFGFPDLTGASDSDLCSKRLCATVCVDGQC